MKNRTSSILFHTAGIYTFFLLYSYYQEKITTSLYEGVKYTSVLFPIYLHSLGGIVASEAALYIKKEKRSVQNNSLLYRYIFLSLLSLISAQFWNFSLRFLTYPTVVISKSCKLLSIALMNFIIYRTKLSTRKYFILILTTSSVLLFALGDSSKKESSSFGITGLFLLIINLAVDGFSNVIQDKIFKEYKVSSLNMMYYLNLIRFVISMILLIMTQNMRYSFTFMYKNPSLAIDLGLSTIFNVLGQLFIFSMIEKHGTIILSTVNITRKILSILVSFIIFGHSLSFIQGISIIGVILSISLEFGSKEDKKIKEK
ncbi:hypothetical protein P3W45_000034 [Vairimorpha bombi]|jgi:solute carrier family 35 (UDP-galactose transporter), member B1